MCKLKILKDSLHFYHIIRNSENITQRLHNSMKLYCSIRLEIDNEKLRDNKKNTEVLLNIPIDQDHDLDINALRL